MTGSRRRRSRLLLALLVVVLLEGALQLAAPLVQRAMLRADDSPSADAPLTLLCVGDSNTYGLHLPRVYAYPALLEAVLSARYRDPVTVVNRGVPGQNTAQVATGLLQDLADVQPDVVLVLAGINDTWNTDREGGGPWSWLGRSRLLRLARVLAAGVTSAGRFEIATDDEGEIVVDRGDGRRRVNLGAGATLSRDGAPLEDAITAGLGRAIDACRDFGAVPVLMTYVEYQGVFEQVNATVRTLAAERGVLLVDHERAFQGHFAALGYDNLMFTDHHPNQAGYRLMVTGIVEVLVEAGLVPDAVLDASAAVEGAPPPFLPRLLAARRDGVLIEGPPGWAWQVIVSEAPRDAQDGFDIGATRVPLHAGELLALSRHEPSFSGRFAADPVRLRIPEPIRRGASGPLALCVLLLRDLAPGGGESGQPAIAAVAGPFPLDAD